MCGALTGPSMQVLLGKNLCFSSVPSILPCYMSGYLAWLPRCFGGMVVHVWKRMPWAPKFCNPSPKPDLWWAFQIGLKKEMAERLLASGMDCIDQQERDELCDLAIVHYNLQLRSLNQHSESESCCEEGGGDLGSN